jgi:hypothetical protein
MRVNDGTKGQVGGQPPQVAPIATSPALRRAPRLLLKRNKRSLLIFIPPKPPNLVVPLCKQPNLVVNQNGPLLDWWIVGRPSDSWQLPD